MLTINNVKDVIEVLGGLSSVAKLADADYATAWHWKNNNKFPAKTYVVLSSALAKQGYAAHPKLWGMVPATKP